LILLLCCVRKQIKYPIFSHLGVCVRAPYSKVRRVAA